MAGIDLANRVHNHNYKLDPFVRSLLDTDFYKLLMGQFVFNLFGTGGPDVTFTVRNRTRSVRMCDLISEEDLRAQLDFVKGLRFTKNELIWLQGNTFYGQTGIFSPEYVQALRDLTLPDYELTRDATGEYVISFTGPWIRVKFWEIYVLSILNEAKSRAGMADMSAYELRVLYANATSKLHGKLKTLREAGVPRISEFGTRRRHGFVWQSQVIEAMREELGEKFVGTSNALHAMRMDIDAVGTNAHELPMVMAALTRILRPEHPGALEDSQFEVLRLWERTFSGNLLVALPDTFGTTQFLSKAPAAFPAIAGWTGVRLDSKDPAVGAEEMIAFWQSLGRDPREKLMLFSDGLNADTMVDLHRAFGGRCRDAYGWGTLATNDFRGCSPRGDHALDPISVVCKVTSVRHGDRSISAVKLSDNYEKATGGAEEVEAYRAVFGTAGVTGAPLVV